MVTALMKYCKVKEFYDTLRSLKSGLCILLKNEGGTIQFRKKIKHGMKIRLIKLSRAIT